MSVLNRAEINCHKAHGIQLLALWYHVTHGGASFILVSRLMNDKDGITARSPNAVYI